jgi:AmpE protein
MNLIALFLGLLLERILTRLLHLREFRVLDKYFDYGFARMRKTNQAVSLILGIVLVGLPCVPVFFIAIKFSHLLYGIPYLVFAALVLLFSLGPRDLGREVEDYCKAVEAEDQRGAESIAKELLEADAPRRPHARDRALEDAVFVQANNRLFGVIFWFMILGPMGAWLFRVMDLMRRRANFEARRDGVVDVEEMVFLSATQRLHWLLAWVPARLLALGYALAGSFEDAVADWRTYYQECSPHFFDANEEVVACVGKGALGLGQEEAQVSHLRAAMRLVNRTLFIWVAFISVIILFGWRL